MPVYRFTSTIDDIDMGDAFWSPSYCVVSCGGAPLETIRAYIQAQDRPPAISGRNTRSSHQSTA